MSRSVEASGPDVDSAIAEALAELKAERDQVEVEILEQPVRRLLGLGVRPARVRVTVQGEDSTNVGALREAPAITSVPTPSVPTQVPRAAIPVVPTAPPPEVESAAEYEDKPLSVKKATVQADAEPTGRPPRRESEQPTEREDKPRSPKRGRRETGPSPTATAPSFEVDPDSEERHEPITDEQFDREAQVGVEVVQRILGCLAMEADVNARHTETDGREARHWLIDVHGQDLAALIGTKGETLAALQYVARLVASKQLGHRANLVVDVDGYKAQREEKLRRLAKRMAGQAVELKRTVSLEPMPPHERRIVHLTLRDHPDVTTESVGEGDRRKVTIVPRRKPQN